MSNASKAINAENPTIAVTHATAAAIPRRSRTGLVGIDHAKPNSAYAAATTPRPTNFATAYRLPDPASRRQSRAAVRCAYDPSLLLQPAPPFATKIIATMSSPIITNP
jgi:hypothetical protein